MKSFGKMTLTAGALALGSVACADQAAAPGATGTSLSVQVAPLTLPLMTDACYGLSVYNTTDVEAFSKDTLVWSQPNLCASQYGAEGGIRFTGICDASAKENGIRLVLNDVYANGTARDGGKPLEEGTDYVNPCPAPANDGDDNGCVLKAACVENQDTKITFNLTVMRNASLGFFDTIVKFQDVFCAAKLDCVEADGSTLTYLHNPNTGADGATAVLAFACTGDANASGTFLYLDQVVVTCTDLSGEVTRTATIDPSAEMGNVTPDDPNEILFGAAVNRGDGLNGAAYWNVLMGMNLNGATGETCTVSTKAFASDVALKGGATPDHTRYPVIKWNVDLSFGSERVCERHPLNNSNGDVQTFYTAIDVPEQINYELERGNNGQVVTNVGISIPRLFQPYLDTFNVVRDFSKFQTERVTKMQDIWASLAQPTLEDAQGNLAQINNYLEQTQMQRRELQDTQKQLQESVMKWFEQYPSYVEAINALQKNALSTANSANRAIDQLLQTLQQFRAELQQFIALQGS